MCTHRTEHQLIYYIYVKASPDTVLQDVFILSDFLQSKFRDNPIMGYVVRSKQVSSATSTSGPFNRNSLEDPKYDIETIVRNQISVGKENVFG